MHVNPAIIPNAFLMSAMIFAAFSGAALFAPDGQYLFLGGTLISGLSTLFWLGFLNIFFQSQLIFQVMTLLYLVSYHNLTSNEKSLSKCF
jgi:fatty-acid desaturase